MTNLSANMFRPYRLVLTAAMALSSTIAAQAILIDDYNAERTPAVTANGDNAPNVSGTEFSANILGGSRDWQLSLVNFLPADTASYEVDDAEGLIYSNRSGSNSNLRLTYDGIAGSPTNPFTLGVDLTSDGSDSLRLTLSELDLSTTFTFSVLTSTGTRTSILNVSGPFTNDQAFEIPFASFGGTGSFTQVQGISLFVQPDDVSRDVTIRRLETFDATPVPEPSTALVAVALCGCAGLIRRRSARCA